MSLKTATLSNLIEIANLRGTKCSGERFTEFIAGMYRQNVDKLGIIGVYSGDQLNTLFKNSNTGDLGFVVVRANKRTKYMCYCRALQISI